MTDQNSEDRDRLIRLEQSFKDSIPLIRDSLGKVIENQKSLEKLVIELTEQSKKFPAIDEDMRSFRADFNQLALRVERQEIATSSLDRDVAKLDGEFSKFVNDDFKQFRKDFSEVTNSMNKNSWTLNLVRFVVISLFGGAVTLAVAILSGVLSS